MPHFGRKPEAKITSIEHFLQNGSGVIFAVENFPSSQANAYPMLWPRIYAGIYADTDNVARMNLTAAQFAAKLPKTPAENLLQLQWIMPPQLDEEVYQRKKGIKVSQDQAHR